MKRLFALLLIFCLFPLPVLGASSPSLPDLGAFSDSELETVTTEEESYIIKQKYSGSLEQVASIVEAYVELLEKSYDLKMSATFRVQHSQFYILNYKGTGSMGGFNVYNDDYHWRCNDCQVYIDYTIPESGVSNLWIYYRPEFHFQDTGDRYSGNAQAAPSPTAKSTAKATAKPSSSRCSVCGGDGVIERDCANCGGDGKRDCMSCAGKGYNNCSGCGGTGRRRCGYCYGSGKYQGKRCSSCSGLGYKTCSSCTGGKKRCSACSGSGDRRCTSCSGKGRKSSRCTYCGGDGIR